MPDHDYRSHRVGPPDAFSDIALVPIWGLRAVWKLPVAKNSDLSHCRCAARIFRDQLAIPEVRPIGMVLATGVLAGDGNRGVIFAPASGIRCGAIRSSHNFNSFTDRISISNVANFAAVLIEEWRDDYRRGMH
jgi:hypothetical protein